MSIEDDLDLPAACVSDWLTLHVKPPQLRVGVFVDAGGVTRVNDATTDSANILSSHRIDLKLLGCWADDLFVCLFVCLFKESLDSRFLKN